MSHGRARRRCRSSLISSSTTSRRSWRASPRISWSERMKKLLFLFDTDPYASVFDTVVAYDGGANRVAGYANVTPDNVGALVDGTIFTRGGKEKQNTAIFVGGGDMAKGEALLNAVNKKFFGPFRVSLMLDSNGSNTTAAAGVALLAQA